MAVTPVITIEDLTLAGASDRLHRLAVMKDGKTAGLTVGMIADLVLGDVPVTLNSLEKLADAIGNDPSFFATVATHLSQKLDTLQPFIDVASAATLDLGAVASRNIRVTGNTSVSSFGVAPAGIIRTLRFASALTLTHNSASLILPNGGANISIEAGDSIDAVSLGSGNWFVINYQKSRVASKMAVLQDQKPSGNNGGNAVVGWQTRTLNTEVSDPDNIVTLSANAFVTTIDCWVDAECEAFLTTYNMLRIWNVTDGVEVARGVNQYSGTTAPGWSSQPRVQGRIAAGKAYRVEMYAASSQTGTGLGTGANAGSPEIFCSVVLRGLN